MVILSDCLTEKVDEGCLKVANSLTKRIKKYEANTTVVSYDRKPKQSDIHLQLNKMFLNSSLLSLIIKKKEPVLYIPFASNTKASALRIFVLSLVAKYGFKVIFVLRFSMDRITKTLLKASRVQIVALSKESYDFYSNEIGNAVYLQTGIDTNRFVPVSIDRKDELRRKYKVVPGKKVLLHVGHLKNGRNVDKLLQVGEDYHVFLIVSSVTENEQDAVLRKKLTERPNTTIIDSYLENIEEVYQMADVYLFPVQESENCIDVPLSVLEAAACNIPVVTTNYGELKSFKGEAGFKFISGFDAVTINNAIDEMATMENCKNRDAVLVYDWDASVKMLLKQ